MTMSYAYHAYQTEVFPTAIRARASGLVYSMSRISAMFSGFIVAYMLRVAGVNGVFGLITTAMILLIITIRSFAPDVRGNTHHASPCPHLHTAQHYLHAPPPSPPPPALPP